MLSKIHLLKKCFHSVHKIQAYGGANLVLIAVPDTCCITLELIPKYYFLEKINTILSKSFLSGQGKKLFVSICPGIDSWVQSWVSWVEPGLPRKPSSGTQKTQLQGATNDISFKYDIVRGVSK